MARTRAQDYDAKRLVILHKSAELFAQYGYSGTSITMIADACGVSKALLYHYYPDKEAVLFDILSAQSGSADCRGRGRCGGCARSQRAAIRHRRRAAGILP